MYLSLELKRQVMTPESFVNKYPSVMPFPGAGMVEDSCDARNLLMIIASNLSDLEYLSEVDQRQQVNTLKTFIFDARAMLKTVSK